MSAIEPEVSAQAAGLPLYAIGLDRFMPLHTAPAGSGLEEITSHQPSAQ